MNYELVSTNENTVLVHKQDIDNICYGGIGPNLHLPIKYKSSIINLTEKPWGCICGYCRENDTLYFHEPNLNVNEKMNNMKDVQIEMLNKCQEYYDTLSRIIGKKGYIWLRNDETGQLMIYTRGEYTNELIDFLKTLE